MSVVVSCGVVAAVTAVTTVAVPSAALAVRLSATALIMGATNQVLSIPPATPEGIRDYVVDRYRDFIEPTGLCAGATSGCNLVAVYTPEQLGPFSGLLDMTFDQSVAQGLVNLGACVRGAACMLTAEPYLDTDNATLTDTSYVVSGGSQSAIIASYQKAALIADPAEGRTVSFVITSSPSRPNGGFFARFPGGFIPFVGLTFAPATPTNSPREAPLLTVDIARQYDGWDDFPTNPLNLLATANALLGTIMLHSDAIFADGEAQLQGYFQDTTYYLAPTVVVPVLQPIAAVPLIGMPIAMALDAPLRVLIETGYDRTLNPGQPVSARYLYFPNPVQTLVNVAAAIPTGWDDAIAFTTGDPANRPFRTTPAEAFGVGGPPVYAGAVDPYQTVTPPNRELTGATPPTAQAGVDQTGRRARTATPLANISTRVRAASTDLASSAKVRVARGERVAAQR